MQRSKAEIRREVRDRLAKLSEGERRAADEAISTRLTGIITEERPEAVLAYLAMRDEVNLAPLLEEVRRLGIPLFAPVVTDQGLAFHALETDPSDTDAARLTRHPFGMLEPASSAPKWTPPATAGTGGTTIILCPGRAFDTAGYRVGRGGGYYDGFLASLRNRPDRATTDTAVGTHGGAIIAIGICYEVQIFSEVPHTTHDQRIDLLVTEDRRISTITV
jgi:5-formyltetrahydrofolate cyclo-ligase